jgi:hypothetical protein
LEYQLSAVLSPGIVIETTEVCTLHDGLHIARIIVIEQVEYGNAGTYFQVPLT